MNDVCRKVSSGELKLGIVGLGYVGLPLAVEYGKHYNTVGFDINERRINALMAGQDSTLETNAEELAAAGNLTYSTDPEKLRGCDVYIVTVPTPVDKYNQPDLTPLYKASETVGKVMSAGCIVVYESTVYPGCTEEECVPVLEKFSGLTFNKDFFCGYSPERINPGDKERTLTKILKITSGSTPEAAKAVNALYSSIIKAGTHQAPSIKVAEAAKVIENSQRDINIAFVNELSKIFKLIGIDTLQVLEAAGTKWNFLPFRPGLVGGHCIGVDPYYLTRKAESLGYHPEIILSGRRLNDGMGNYVAGEIVKLMIRKEHTIKNSRILLLGLTFKENCPDIRNSRVVDVFRGLQEFGCVVDVYDPWANPEDVKHEYGIELIKNREVLKTMKGNYDAVVLAVAHRQFKELDYSNFNKAKLVVYDIKGILPPEMVDGRL